MDVLGTAGPAITQLANNLETRLAAIAPGDVQEIIKEFKADLAQILTAGQEVEAIAVQATNLLHSSRDVVAKGSDVMDIGKEAAQGILDLINQFKQDGVVITIAPAVKDKPTVQ